jgi:gluconokinase
MDRAGSLEDAVGSLSPGLFDEAGPDATVVASEADSAAYRAARASARGRLHDLTAAADLLAGTITQP